VDYNSFISGNNGSAPTPLTPGQIKVLQEASKGQAAQPATSGQSGPYQTVNGWNAAAKGMSGLTAGMLANRANQGGLANINAGAGAMPSLGNLGAGGQPPVGGGMPQQSMITPGGGMIGSSPNIPSTSVTGMPSPYGNPTGMMASGTGTVPGNPGTGAMPGVPGQQNPYGSPMFNPMSLALLGGGGGAG
jgi:hypothetical protein